MQTDLVGFSDAPDLNLRFLAMLAGPFYPILHLVNERLGYLACYTSCITCQESFVLFCSEHFHFKDHGLGIMFVSWFIEWKFTKFPFNLSNYSRYSADMFYAAEQRQSLLEMELKLKFLRIIRCLHHWPFLQILRFFYALSFPFPFFSLPFMFLVALIIVLSSSYTSRYYVTILPKVKLFYSTSLTKFC